MTWPAEGGFLKGPVEDRALGEKIAKETGIPVAISSAAVAEALRALGAKRTLDTRMPDAAPKLQALAMGQLAGAIDLVVVGADRINR